jgi:hypothetical protein
MPADLAGQINLQNYWIFNLWRNAIRGYPNNFNIRLYGKPGFPEFLP